MPKPRTRKPSTTTNDGFEAKLWQMAGALRGSRDAAKYTHVTLGAMPSIVRTNLVLADTLPICWETY